MRSALGVGRAALFRQVVDRKPAAGARRRRARRRRSRSASSRVFKAIGGHAIPRLDAVTTGWPVLACGLGSARRRRRCSPALVPALRASRLDPMDVLKSARAEEQRRPRRAPAAARRHDGADRADARAARRRRPAHSHDEQHVRTCASGYRIDHILTMTVDRGAGRTGSTSTRARSSASRRCPASSTPRSPGACRSPATTGPASSRSKDSRRRARPSDAIALPLRSVTPGYLRAARPDAHRRPRLPLDRRSRRAARSPSSIKALADRYFAGRDRDRQEALDARTRAAGDGNHRRRDERPHRRSDARRRNRRSTSRSGRRRRSPRTLIVRTTGGPALDRGGRAARTARGRSDGRRREHQDAGADPRRFAGVAHLRDAAAGRLRRRRHAC